MLRRTSHPNIFAFVVFNEIPISPIKGYGIFFLPILSMLQKEAVAKIQHKQ